MRACVPALVYLSTALTSPEMHMAPDDWPNKVTQPGSPPKAAMFFGTQRRAATWSSGAQFPRAWLSPVLSARGSRSGSGAPTLGCWGPPPRPVCPSETGSYHRISFLIIGRRPIEAVASTCLLQQALDHAPVTPLTRIRPIGRAPFLPPNPLLPPPWAQVQRRPRPWSPPRVPGPAHLRKPGTLRLWCRSTSTTFSRAANLEPSYVEAEPTRKACPGNQTITWARRAEA